MGSLESRPGGSQNSKPNRYEFGHEDFLLAEQILKEHTPQEPAVPNQHHTQEWQFYKRQGSNPRTPEATGDIAEAVVFSTLSHEKSPFHSFKNIQVAVELASRGDDIVKGFDGLLKIFNSGRELASIRYDATTNPTAVLRKIEEAAFYPKDSSHTKVVLGFDITSPTSPWTNVKEGSFSAPSFFILLKEMEMQLKAYEAYAQKAGEAKRAARYQQELLFVRYMLQHSATTTSPALLQDKVFVAIEEASRQVAATDPKSFRMGRANAA